MLEKKLEGVGYGAGSKIALNRSETVGKQGGGSQAVSAEPWWLNVACAWVKDFQGCSAEWRRAGNWPCPTTPPALGCSPAPNNKPPRDLISSWAALIQIQGRFWAAGSRDTKDSGASDKSRQSCDKLGSR